ncbi:MAG: hypothetical protein ACRDGK_10680 [Actinomycetota bacterium]
MEDLTGSSFADVLTGDEGPNTIVGGSGPDALAGAAGDDVLLGANGNDQADGGVGSDMCEAETEVACEVDPTGVLLIWGAWTERAEARWGGMNPSERACHASNLVLRGCLLRLTATRT